VWAVPDTGRNLVRHAVRRQLGVRPHTVADLHAGIRAALRVRPGRTPPPREALHAYLHDQPGYELDGGTARAKDVDLPLVASDAVIVEAFRAACAEALSMSQLRQALSAAGFGESGARHLVRGSPILRRTGFGRYTLSGRVDSRVRSAD